MNGAVQVDAYRNTVRGATITLLIEAASTPMETSRYGFWPVGFFDVLHALQALVVVLCLLRYGKRWTTSTLDTLFVFVAAPFLLTLWLPPVAELGHGLPIEPLLGHHFAMLALAMITPSSYRLSVGLVVLFSSEAIVLAEYLRDRGAGSQLGREPYFTLFFTGIALAVQWSAFRRRALAMELAKAETRGEAHAKTSRILLGMRDRANSPLQTIEIGLRVLEQRAVEQHMVLRTLRGALRKLVDLQRGLAELEASSDPSATLDLGGDLDERLRDLDPARQPPPSLGSSPRTLAAAQSE